MKNRIILALLGVSLMASNCLAAMSASIVWEWRDSATANMVNGGGFKTGASGTDYSLQNAAQWTASDGTSTASTTFISLTSTFTSAIVGNVLHITAGTGATVGWYEVTGYTDANTITLDRVSGTYTAATFYVGGALNVGGSLEDSFFEQLIAGQIVYFKTGSFTTSQAINTAVDGTYALLIKLEGYQTTRGDNPTGANRPDLILGANGLTLDDYWVLKNLDITGTSSTVVRQDVNGIVHNCKITNTSGTANRVAHAHGGNFWYSKSEFSSTSGYGIDTAASSTIMVYGCYIHDSTVGVRYGNDNAFFALNIFDTCTTGLSSSGVSPRAVIINNTFYSSTVTGTKAISLTSATSGVLSLQLFNNIITGFGTGYDGPSQGTNYNSDYNNWSGNTNDIDGTDMVKGSNETALDPGFTDAANADFRVGANMKATAFPGTFPGAGASCIGYLDQGAVQRVEPAGGTTNDVFGIM